MKKTTFLMVGLISITAIATLHFKPAPAINFHKDLAQADTSCPCKNSFNKITYGPVVPGDASSTSGQSDFDCFAWAEFIALNWSTNPNAGFGDPMNLDPVQWETYIQKEALFPPQGAAPGPWNTQNQNLSTYKSTLLAKKLPTSTKVLRFDSKFSGTKLIATDSISESGQAFPFTGPSWLGAQDSTNVWYEVLLNKDIYDYVVKHQYFNAINQAKDANKGIPINFPLGVTNGITGAIELKAAWMEVTNPTNAKWKRYKLSRAVVVDLNTGNPRKVIVALVGLHVLHKTQSQPGWVWATFEQVDNVPAPNDPAGKQYNFFNPACKDSSNVPPSYELVLGGKRPMPINIERVNAMDPTAIATNSFIQNQIKSIYPNSVWQYYQLVNVIWQNNPAGVTDTTSNLPFVFNAPAGTHTANTTMESYIQTNTCVNCHTFSTIAIPTNSNQVKYFGDFSFAIGDATSPKQKSLYTRKIQVSLKK